MRDRRRGFSLIELMLVLVILGISMAAVYTSLDGLLPSSRLGAAAREIGSLVALARRQAALGGEPTQLLYDLENGRVQVLIPVRSSGDGGPRPRLRASDFEVLLPGTVKMAAVITADGQGKRGGRVTIEVTPDGGAVGHVVQLKGAGDLVYTVEVQPLTGLIQIHDRAVGPPPVRQDG